MATEADLAGLLAHAQEPDEGCPFVFSNATHPHDTDAVAALRRAITSTSAAAASLYPHSEARADAPHLSPNGAASSFGMFEDLNEDVIARWFVLLAHTLTEAGWSGTLRPQPSEDWPEDRQHSDSWIATTLGFSLVRHQSRFRPPWAVDATLVPRMVDLAMQWTKTIHGDLWFVHVNAVRGDEAGVRAALAARLSDDTSSFATVHVQGVRAERRIKFSSYGHVTLEDRAPSAPSERLATLRTWWLAWAALLDRSATTGDVGSGGHPTFVELGRRDNKLLMSYLGHRRDLDARRVPDACVEQLLTRAHLDASHDLSAWNIEEVAPGRFLVSHPDPSRWFLPAPAGERGTKVDPAVLAAARQDFGAMILSEKDLR